MKAFTICRGKGSPAALSRPGGMRQHSLPVCEMLIFSGVFFIIGKSILLREIYYDNL